MIAPGLDVNLDHELNRELYSCDGVTQPDSVGIGSNIGRRPIGTLSRFALPATPRRSMPHARVWYVSLKEGPNHGKIGGGNRCWSGRRRVCFEVNRSQI